ncbi:MAG TPA: SDR family oxidoreductase [Candidatus Corynebacterium avicola]|uniref:SDR family oxidoreductase n=1 Tax=Candidatus Corynebacterium avicola TaxID=2838527 RepID=A0A9D1RMX8_9CORY|nr:SDR family oxidoreductase [Candidatus Corynebacterium avicola]
MGQLDSKVALVTGGTTGIGLAAAQRFATEGATVFVTGRRQAELDAAVKIGGAARGIRSDVSVPEQLDALMETIRAEAGHLDVLFANAGGGDFASLTELTPEHFDRIFSVNVQGTVFTLQKALPLLREGSSVVITGSSSASRGVPGFGTYSASKAALRQFVRVWAAELAPSGIRVNTLVPGSTDTPGLRALAPDKDAQHAMLSGMRADIPLDRLADPEEIASAALFLASEQSSFVTGSELFADGGEAQVYPQAG